MTANRFERSREGFHRIGDLREVLVVWENGAWYWRGVGPGTDEYSGGPYDTSAAAYRSALETLG